MKKENDTSPQSPDSLVVDESDLPKIIPTTYPTSETFSGKRKSIKLWGRSFRKKKLC